MKSTYILLACLCITSSSLALFGKKKEKKPKATQQSLSAVDAVADATREIERLAEQSEKPKLSTTAQVVLTNFLAILAHVAYIIRDPRDKSALGNHITGIFSRIVSIALQAGKRGFHTEEEMRKFLEEELMQNAEFRALIEQELLILHRSMEHISEE